MIAYSHKAYQIIKTVLKFNRCDKTDSIVFQSGPHVMLQGSTCSMGLPIYLDKVSWLIGNIEQELKVELILHFRQFGLI